MVRLKSAVPGAIVCHGMRKIEPITTLPCRLPCFPIVIVLYMSHKPMSPGTDRISVERRVILACRLGQQLKLVLINCLISCVVNVPSMPIFLFLFRLVTTVAELQQGEHLFAIIIVSGCLDKLKVAPYRGPNQLTWSNFRNVKQVFLHCISLEYPLDNAI